MNQTELTILLPYFNEADSLQRLLADIDATIPAEMAARILLVNDGSTEPLPTRLPTRIPIDCIHLVRNLGHQKAIAVGLSYIHRHIPTDHVLVMDSDGEDIPADIIKLVGAQRQYADKLIFSTRGKRGNGLRFKMGYFVYRLAFRWLTGRKMSFGNFSCLPVSQLSRLIYYPELWSHYPGTVIRSGLPYHTIALDRGRRYAGESKMSFTQLVLHGLGAMSVFLEKIITRLAIGSFLLMCLALVSIAGIFVTRFATNLAIPGWASTLSSSMLIILLVSFLISLMAVFFYLASQTQQKIIPAVHYQDYILAHEKLNHEG